MAKIFHRYDGEALARTLDRIKEGTDSGSQIQRPAFDPLERRDLEARSADGRSSEAFRQVLERHGFRWFPAAVVARAAVAAGTAPVAMAGEAAPEIEGQWRCRRLAGGVAFTPTDVLAQFQTPEDFDRWASREKTKARLLARGVSKVERRVALSRS